MDGLTIYDNIRVHELKVWNEFFDALTTSDLSKRKTFEVRQKRERDFQVGDYLYLREYDMSSDTYSGRTCYRKITYVLDDIRFLPENVVVLSLIDEIPNIK